MNFDFRFLNSAGRWEARGHRRGADRAAAIQAMRDAGVGLPAGAYMSRPRGRQKDWDLFSLDPEGRVTEVDRSPAGASTL